MTAEVARVPSGRIPPASYLHWIDGRGEWVWRCVRCEHLFGRGWGCVSCLQPVCRVCVYDGLHTHQDRLGYRRITTLLGMPHSKVARIEHVALCKLRRALQAEEARAQARLAAARPRILPSWDALPE